MGIFMPSIMIGGCLGASVGAAFNDCVGYGHHVTQSMHHCVYTDMYQLQKLLGPWALLGAASTLAGIQRTVISLCVIILEGTGQVTRCVDTCDVLTHDLQIRFLLPTVIATSVAKWIGDQISLPIYEVICANPSIGNH